MLMMKPQPPMCTLFFTICTSPFVGKGYLFRVMMLLRFLLFPILIQVNTSAVDWNKGGKGKRLEVFYLIASTYGRTIKSTKGIMTFRWRWAMQIDLHNISLHSQFAYHNWLRLVGIIKTRQSTFHYTFVIYRRNLDCNYKIWATFTTSSYTRFSGNNNNNTANLRQHKLLYRMSNILETSNLSRAIISGWVYLQSPPLPSTNSHGDYFSIIVGILCVQISRLQPEM